MGGLVLDMWIEFLVRAFFRAYLSLGTERWPVARGTIQSTALTESFTWLKTARITYTYTYDGQEFEGTDAQPFLHDKSAEYHMSVHGVGSTLEIRVNPNQPSQSIYRAPVAILWGSKPLLKNRGSSDER